jgi:transcription initiation factor TFIIA large subunit
MAANDVKKIYQEIIDDVCKAVREALSEEGYDDHTLQELRTLWLTKLESSRALEPLPVSTVDQATNREYRHPATGDNNTKQSTAVKVNRIHPVSNTAVTNFNTNFATNINSGILSAAPTTTAMPNTTQFIRPNFPIRPTNPTNMKTSNQLDGAHDEIIKKKSSKKKITVEIQLDGTGPPLGDDDDEDVDSDPEANDVGDELDDEDDDDGNEEGREDPNPLCSDDDVSEDEPTELFDTENVVVCQYDRISRTKNKWRFILKSGVMNIDGRDYVFSKATGDADW